MQFQDNWTFDSASITKYFKNQTPMSFSGSESFTDPYFPANNNSLMGLDTQGNPTDQEAFDKEKSEINESNTEWKRIGRIFGEFKLFIGKIEMDDIKQGSLGNCYFLSALAALTKYPKLIANLFRTTHIESGYYEVILFVDGEWQIVLVDDHFPVSKEDGKLLFCKPNMNEVWAIVIEKAWAKVNGGYLNTIGGLCGEVLQVLTGAPYLGVTNTYSTKENLWSMFNNAYKNNYVIGTGTMDIPHMEKLGLAKQHAYSVLQLEEFVLNGMKYQLIKLRNPWGNTEWNGDWGDNSPLWTAELKEKLKLKIDDDGAFWMSFDEYIRFYDQADIAYLQFESKNYGHIIEDSEILNHPLIYRLKISSKTNVAISVFSKNSRFNRETKKENKGFTVLISLNNSSGLPENLIKGTYATKDSLSFLAELDQGEYSVFIYGAGVTNTLFGKLSVKFSLSSFGCLKFMGYDKNLNILRSLTLKKIEEEYKQLYEDNEYFCDQIPGFIDKYGVLPVLVKNNRKKPVKISLSFYMNFGVTFTPILGKNYEKSDKIEIKLAPLQGYVILMTAGQLQVIPPSIGISIPSCEIISASETVNEDPYNSQPCELVSVITGSTYSYYINSDYSSQESSSYSYTGKDTLDELYYAVNFRVEYYNALKTFIEDNVEIVGYDLKWNKFEFDDKLYLGQLNKDGKFHGYGLLKENFIIYVGYFKDGMKDLRGKIYYDFSESSPLTLDYYGEFSNNKKNGYGKEFINDKPSFYGLFQNDKKIEGLSCHTDCLLWKGKIKNGKKHGVGILFIRYEKLAFEFEYEWDDPVNELPWNAQDARKYGYKEFQCDPEEFKFDF